MRDWHTHVLIVYYISQLAVCIVGLILCAVAMKLLS